MGITRIAVPMKVKIDETAILDSVVLEAIGAIKSRVDDGLDVNDKKFAPYSEGYRKRLEKAGEDLTPDLRVSGGMLKSIAEVKRETVDGQLVVTISPDARPSTSERSLKPANIRGKSPEAEKARQERKKRKAAARKAATTRRALRALHGYEAKEGDGQPPQHDAVGYWHQHGSGKNPVREWLGLSPSDMKRVLLALEKVKPFKTES